VKGLIITSENASDIKIIKDIAARIGAKTKSLNVDDVLDMGMSIAIKQGRKRNYISKESVIKMLKT
jgi:hypothetical protein